jgi:hypothetical protein
MGERIKKNSESDVPSLLLLDITFKLSIRSANDIFSNYTFMLFYTLSFHRIVRVLLHFLGKKCTALLCIVNNTSLLKSENTYVHMDFLNKIEVMLSSRQDMFCKVDNKKDVTKETKCTKAKMKKRKDRINQTQNM